MTLLVGHPEGLPLGPLLHHRSQPLCPVDGLMGHPRLGELADGVKNGTICPSMGVTSSPGRVLVFGRATVPDLSPNCVRAIHSVHRRFGGSPFVFSAAVDRVGCCGGRECVQVPPPAPAILASLNDFSDAAGPFVPGMSLFSRGGSDDLESAIVGWVESQASAARSAAAVSLSSTRL
jgi:hypothetical protein